MYEEVTVYNLYWRLQGESLIISGVCEIKQLQVSN